MVIFLIIKFYHYVLIIKVKQKPWFWGYMHLKQIIKSNHVQLKYHACGLLRMCSKMGDSGHFSSTTDKYIHV